MSPRVVFAGPPGSGKGTQAERLRRLGFVHLSSGAMLRAEIAAGSARGRAIAALVNHGGLVADALMNEVVDGFLRTHAADAVVLDGYPRNLAQARHLGTAAVTAALFFRIADERLLRRIQNRVLGPDGAVYDLERMPPPPGVSVVRRADDDPETLRHRLVVYHEEEAALWSYYAQAGRAYAIQADAAPDAVHAEVLGVLEKLGVVQGVSPRSGRSSI